MTTTLSTADELLLRDALSDPSAQQALLDAVWPRAFRVALGVLGDPAAAEDVAQETCLKLLHGAQGYDRDRPLRPWYLRVARNAALDRQRAQRRRRGHERRAARPERVAPTVDADVLTVREQLQRLDDAVRETLALHYLEGLTQREAAEVLACPAGTVASRVKRGLSQLREALTPALAGAVASLLPASLATPAPPAPSVQALLARAQGPVALEQGPRAAVSVGRRASGPVALAVTLATALVGAALGLGLLSPPRRPASATSTPPGEVSETGDDGAVASAGGSTGVPGDPAGVDGEGRRGAAAAAGDLRAVEGPHARIRVRAFLNGQPWPGAAVVATTHEALQRLETHDWHGDGEPGRYGLTDAEGRVTLSLGEGNWVLRVHTPLREVPAWRDPDPEHVRLPESFDVGEQLRVQVGHPQPDENERRLVFLDDPDRQVALGETLDVEARATADLVVRGRVVDAEGAPLPDAWVWDGGGSEFVADAEPPNEAFRCRPDGTFLLALRRDEERIRLSAASPDHATTTLTIADASPLTITLLPGKRVRVKLLDPQGRPYTAGSVTIRANLPGGSGEPWADEPPSWVTYAPVTAEGVTVRLPANAGRGHVLFDVEAQVGEDYRDQRFLERRFALGPGQDVAEVRFPADLVVSGAVHTPGGDPVPGASLIVAREHRGVQSYRGFPGAGVSDGLGRFELSLSHPEPPLCLLVLAPGCAPAWVTPRDDGTEWRGLEVVVHPAIDLDAQVVWADGAPTKQARVFAFAPDQAPETIWLTSPQADLPYQLADGTSDAQGAVRLADVPAGPLAWAVAVGGRLFPVEPRIAGDSLTLPLPCHAPAGLSLTPTDEDGSILEQASVEVEVLHAEQGFEAVPYSPLSMWAHGWRVLGAGPARVLLRVPGRPSVEREVELVPGEPVSLGEVAFPEGQGRVRLRLRYPPGAAIVRVFLVGRDPHTGQLLRFKLEAAADGVAQNLGTLRPGDYRFAVRVVVPPAVGAGYPVGTHESAGALGDFEDLSITVPAGEVEVELDLR